MNKKNNRVEIHQTVEIIVKL